MLDDGQRHLGFASLAQLLVQDGADDSRRLSLVEHLKIAATHSRLKASNELDLAFDLLLVEELLELVPDLLGDLVHDLGGLLVSLSLLNGGARHQTAPDLLVQLHRRVSRCNRLIKVFLTHAQVGARVLDLDHA